MSSQECIVATSDEFVSATRNPGIQKITVRGRLVDVPSIRLYPRQALCGEGDRVEIQFAEGVDGLQLSTDNEIRSVHLSATPGKRSIFNDTSVESLGHLTLAGITANGQVQILAHDKVRSGHVEVKDLDIVTADARLRTERPHGYGVYVIQGAFTLWNMQTDDGVEITADLRGLSGLQDRKRNQQRQQADHHDGNRAGSDQERPGPPERLAGQVDGVFRVHAANPSADSR